jgi:hypothetical protein
MKTAEQVRIETLEAAHGDVAAAIAALEDGAYLADAGYDDDDEQAIEEAHAMLKMSTDRLDALDARPLSVSGLQELINDLNFDEDEDEDDM